MQRLARAQLRIMGTTHRAGRAQRGPASPNVSPGRRLRRAAAGCRGVRWEQSQVCRPGRRAACAHAPGARMPRVSSRFARLQVGCGERPRFSLVKNPQSGGPVETPALATRNAARGPDRKLVPAPARSRACCAWLPRACFARRTACTCQGQCPFLRRRAVGFRVQVQRMLGSSGPSTALRSRLYRACCCTHPRPALMATP
jgi:hypothetical protein